MQSRVQRIAQEKLERLTNKVGFTPQAGPQTDFVNSDSDITIFGGSAGSGKSFSLCLDPLESLRKVKGFGAVIFRRETTQIRAEGSLWDTSQLIYNHYARSRETTLEWIFPNNNQLKFAHMEHLKDRLAWDGSQIAYIGFDELQHFHEEQFWYMASRNRSSCGVKPRMVGTCNPVHKDHPVGGWLRKLLDWWIDSEGYAINARSNIERWFFRSLEDDSLIWHDSQGEALEYLSTYYSHLESKNRPQPKSLRFIKATLDDNKILNEANPEYRANLLSMTKDERERLLEGNWNINNFKGAFFDSDMIDSAIIDSFVVDI